MLASETDNRQTPRQAILRVATESPDARLAFLAGQFEGLELARDAEGAGFALSCYGGHAAFAADGGSLVVTATAADPGALANLRHMTAEAIRYAVPAAELAWTGDGARDAVLPQFRAMRVVERFDVTPRMRRVRLSGRNLARFATGGLHVRLVFPPEGRTPVWPHGDPSGIPVWPSGPDRVSARTYTIRRLDPAAGTVDIDIVRHPGGSPGAHFAETAEPGDPVGMMGPGGGEAPLTGRLLMAGDETALPAIARTLEALPADALGTVFVEVHDTAERQPIDHPPGVELVWLSRGGRPAGTCDDLAEAVTALSWPAEADCFVWIAAELAAYKRLREHCRSVWRLPKRRMSLAPYWRRGEPAPG